MIINNLRSEKTKILEGKIINNNKNKNEKNFKKL